MKPTKVRTFWNEVWVRVTHKAPTVKCYYEVSNYGRIKSVNKANLSEKLIKGSTDQRGFSVVNIRIQNNKRDHFYPHRIVAENFLEKPTGECEYIIHLDHDKKNNYWQNLKWVSKQDWIKDLEKRGVFDKAERREGKHVKMTETKVALLKKRLLDGKTKRKVLARSFGITETQVRRIERGENWGDVEPLQN